MSWFRCLWSLLSPPTTRNKHRRTPTRAQNRYRRLSLEFLETRLVPADVSATLVNGVLTLTAVDITASENLAVSPAASGAPGVFNVLNTGGNIKFGTSTPAGNIDFNGVRALTFILTGGDDIVQIASNSHFAGGLIFNGGTANAAGNSLTINDGCTFGGSVTILNGAATGAHTINIGNGTGGINVGLGLTVNLGSGGTLNVTSSHIGGRLAVVGGVGADQVTVDSTSIGGAFSASLNTGNNTTILNICTVGGAVIVSGGMLNDQVTITDCTIGTAVVANLSNGTNGFVLDSSRMGASVTVVTGSGGDNCSLSATVANSPTIIGGSLITNMGAGDDNVDIQDITVMGRYTAILGAGINSLDIDANAVIPGTVGSFIFGNLSVTSGTGVDTISLGSDNPVFIGGTTTMLLGAEAAGIGDTVNIDDTTFLHTVLIDMGLGVANDTLNVEQGATLAGAKTTFAEKLTLKCGDGTDIAKFGVAMPGQEVDFRVLSALDGGLGTNNQLSIDNYWVFDPSPLVNMLVQVTPAMQSSSGKIASTNFTIV